MDFHALTTIVGSSLERAPWGWVTMSAVLVALVRAWPALSKIAADARASNRKADKEDEDDCNRRIAEVNSKLDAHIEHAHGLEMKLVGAITGYKILDSYIEEREPNAPVLKQSRAAMSTAFTLSPSTTGEPKPPVAVEIRSH